jgi:cell wall-associated NlpC family hydrolase
MQVHSPVPNHGAIFLGGGLMLHHINTRLSATAVYGDFYRKATTHILRHRDIC